MVAIGARAADANCHPIAASEIDRQWQYYASLSGARDIGGGDKYQCIDIESTRAIVCRTKSPNPAHPSIVIRTLIQDSGGISMRTEADTAANCRVFLEMMSEFQELNRKMRESMQNGTQSGRK